MEHAVDAVADPELRLLRLDVDVRRALAVGLGDDAVDELDDRGLFPLGAHVDLGDRTVLVVHGIAAVLDHLLDRVRAHAVKLLHGLVDLLARGEGDRHGAARRKAQAVPGDGGKRIARDDRQHAVRKPERQHVVLVDRARGQLLQDIRARLGLLKLHVVEAEQFAHSAQELGLAHAAEFQDRLDETHLGVLRALLPDARQGLVGVEPRRPQHVLHRSGCFCHDVGLYHKTGHTGN